MNIKKGQKVWVWTDRTGITETTIKTIGRKYITLNYNERVKFNVDSLREVNGCGNVSFIILDLEEYQTKQHYRNARQKLRNFNWNSVENEDIDKIIDILREY